jgi:hypothetical protein
MIDRAYAAMPGALSFGHSIVTIAHTGVRGAELW